MYLLDTNVVSELRKFGTPRFDVAVSAWFVSVKESDCYFSAITLFELELGVRRKERSDPVQGAGLRKWLQGIVTGAEDRILPFDANAAARAADLHVPNPPSLLDSLIAATALTTNLIVVTRNVRDFERLGVELINPWNP